MRDRVQSGGCFTTDEAVAISLAIADGLEVAHGLGVVHRDLKPANVMFQSVAARLDTPGGEKLILTDFGMAKSLARSRGTTIATGTPYYMAPEQAEGKADERSDVYSAAVVLYELLAGRVPYPYDSPGPLFAAQISRPPEPIATLRPDTPPWLAAVVERGLAADPAQRWGGVREWTDALRGGGAEPEPGPPAAPLPGVDSDLLRTMAPEEIAAAKAAQPPAPAPPPPPRPAEHGHKRRRRIFAIGVPLLVAIGAAAAAVVLIVATGAKQADASTLKLTPAGSVGLDPFTSSVVPKPGQNVAVPANPALPQEVSNQGTGIPALVAQILRGLNPAPGAPSTLKFPRLKLPAPSGGQSGGVYGSAYGLYGGTQLLSVCDKRRLVAFLRANPAKLAAWARAERISPALVPAYIAGLTDVVLQADTRVTNHGFRDGVANPIDEVLQAGTAVLVDPFGVPRARCYCGNPLTPPRPLASKPTVSGSRWPGFTLSTAIVVHPAKTKVKRFTTGDVLTGDTFIVRPVGSGPDQSTVVEPTPPPATTTTPTTTTPPPTETVPPPTTTAPAAGATLEFVGFGDHVGRGSVSVPDGVRDAHFRLTLTVSSPTSVTDILLRTADQNGQPCCGQIWNTTVDSYWILGVYRDSSRLNPSDANISDPVSGTVVYDLFANDSGYFKDGQPYLVTVTLAGGTQVGALTAIGSTGTPATTTPPTTTAPATGDAQQAVQLVTGILEQQRDACAMTWSDPAASPISGGWSVTVAVTTSGNPGTAVFGVRGTTVTPSDPLSAEIAAGCP
jgi:hypothetical protein